jgi:putative transposase
MKENNIQDEYVRRMRRKILIKQNRNKNIIKYHDLGNRNFNDIKEIFSILFTNVTYLIWNGKKHYQLTILDKYTKKIINIKWSKFNNNKLVINNLNDAITKIKKIKKDLNKTIIHSNNEYQYTYKY